MTPELRAKLERAISENEILLFMKGTRSAPSCGFSGKTVEILDTLLSNYATVDVLAHPEVRDAIKEFSSWPTIPQLYVRGTFVGGADIIAELFESGELPEKLGLAPPDAKVPTLRVSDRALEAFRGFLGNGDEVILVDIDREYQAGLSVGPRPAQAIFVDESGVVFAFDRLSATRAEGLTIDFVDTPEGSAFKIDSPLAPPKVKDMTVEALAARRVAQVPHRLIDVRTEGEWNLARIEGAELLSTELEEKLRELPLETPLVFQCHHGMRSARVAERFVGYGFREVFNLVGGIDAWSERVDPSVPRY